MKKTNLLQMAKGFALIATALEAEANEQEVNVQETPVKAEKASKKETPAVEVEETVEETEEEGYSIAELKSKKVAELKEIADDLGAEYPDKVRKDDLIDIIMEFEPSEDEDGEDEGDDDVEDKEEEEVEENDGDEDGDELTVEDLEEMTLKELKELADENEIDYPKGVKAPKLRSIIAELLEGDDEDEEEPEEEDGDDGEGDELSPEDLEDMTLKELKELANEYEVEFPKVVKAPKLREILTEALWSDEDEDGDDSTDLDEEDLAEQLGLNDMTVEELAELLTEHKINAKGKKQALIARVVQAIEEGVIEVEEDEGE